MTLQDFISLCHKEKTISACEEIHKNRDSQYVEKKSTRGYYEVFDELNRLTPIPQPEWTIRIDYVTNTLGSEIPPDKYFIVDGIKNGEEVFYGLEFTPWEEWLGMEISFSKSALEQAKSDEELLAEILWEMTFCGYNQVVIQNGIKKLNEEVDEFMTTYKGVDIGTAEKNSIKISTDLDVSELILELDKDN